MRIPVSRRAVGLGVVVLLLIITETEGFGLWRNTFLEEMGIWLFLAILFILGLVPVLGLLWRRHRGIIVLWCRRFGKTRNRWMWAIVSEASRGLACPVTLQDTSIQASKKVEQLAGPENVIVEIIKLKDGRVFATSWWSLYESAAPARERTAN